MTVRGNTWAFRVRKKYVSILLEHSENKEKRGSVKEHKKCAPIKQEKQKHLNNS